MGTDFFDDDLGQRRGAVRTASVGGGTEPVGIPRLDDVPSRPLADLNLTRMARRREEVNTQVAGAKVELERLRRKQGDLEREKQTLEDLLEKQDQYERGKQELIDRMAESMVSLQKLGDHAARQVEIYSAGNDRFAEFVEELQKMNDADWSDEHFREELNKSVARIEAIRKEFVKIQAAIEAVGGPVQLFDEKRPGTLDLEEESPARFGFGTWIKIGFAVSLPVVVALLAVLVVLLTRGH